MLFRGVTVPRVAASIFCGVLLGCAPVASPVWLVILLIILLTRTHLTTVVLAWCAGSVIAWPLGAWYAAAGESVLRAHVNFWSAVVQWPIVCYLELHRARVMGSIVCGAAAGTVVAALALLVWFLWRSRHAVPSKAA